MHILDFGIEVCRSEECAVRPVSPAVTAEGQMIMKNKKEGGTILAQTGEGKDKITLRVVLSRDLLS